MNFKYKSIAEIEAMDAAQKETYATEKRTHEANLVKQQVAEAIKGLPTQADIDALKEANDAQKEVNRIQGETITELKENGAGQEKPLSLVKEIKDKKEDLKALVKGTGSEVQIKAATVRASIVNSNSQLVLPGITQLGVKLRGLYDVFRKVTVADGNNKGKVTYTDWDEATIVRAADMVAEGGTFPESTAKFQSYSIDMKKIGDTLPVSEEFGEDEVSAAAELDMFLRVNMETKVDDALVNADGTGLNIKGFKASIPAFVPVASGISAPNIYDLVKKVKTDITFNRGSKYKPDFVVMNDNVADLLHLEKDANENYIFPDKMNIGSINILIDNNFTDNELAVGDSRYGTIYEKGGVTLERVYVNAQAIEDMITLKARKRMLFLIKNGDATGFRKVTDVAAALATLATV